jgi:transposase
MGLAVQVTRLDHSAAELRAASARCTDGAQVRRMLAIALVLESRPRAEVASLTGMDRQTRPDWVHRYNAEGIAGLKSRTGPGREPYLSAVQKAELRELVIRGPDPQMHKAPAANTEMMNLHLAEISTQVKPGARAVLVCDGAGWHQRGKELRLPHNIRLVSLPPYSPELNPMETVWAYLRQNKLCAAVWDTYDDILAACVEAWNWLIADPARIKSIGTREWACVSN